MLTYFASRHNGAARIIPHRLFSYAKNYSGLRGGQETHVFKPPLQSDMRKIDPTELLRRHIEYSLKRDKWARRGIALSEQGKRKAALDAAEKAEYWDLKAKSLEP
jgi:hypothetical protein